MAKVDIPNRTTEEKETPRKLSKVTTGAVKKKSGVSKTLGNEFVKEEPSYVRDYILGEIVLPAAKNLVADIVNNAVSMFLFGETRGSSRRDSRDRDRGRYSSSSRRRDDYDEPRDRRYRNRMRYDDFSEYKFESRRDAIEVLDELRGYIDDYGQVEVARFFELIGEDSQGVDSDYGWLSLDSAYIDTVRGGYIIEFPKAGYILKSKKKV